MSSIDGEEGLSSPRKGGGSGDTAFLDERFYVVEVLGGEEIHVGYLERGRYLLKARKLGAQVIGKGDRLAMVWLPFRETED